VFSVVVVFEREQLFGLHADDALNILYCPYNMRTQCCQFVVSRVLRWFVLDFVGVGEFLVLCVGVCVYSSS
jgi:hypothetical protein